MSKRRAKKPTPRRAKKSAPRKTVDTGIYTYTVTTVKGDDRDGLMRWGETFCKRQAEALDLAHILRISRSRAEWIIGQSTAGTWDKAMGDREACVRDAQKILDNSDILERHLADGRYELACVFAYWLGRASERLGIRPVEPSAKAGKSTRKNLKVGREVLKTKRAERSENLRREALDAISIAEDELRADGKNPDFMKTTVFKRAAKSLGLKTSEAVRNRLKPKKE